MHHFSNYNMIESERGSLKVGGVQKVNEDESTISKHNIGSS